MGKTRAQIAARRKTPPSAGVPAGAPMLPVEPDEAETARIKTTDPHRVGVELTHTKLKADVVVARAKEAARKKAAQKRRSSK
jgi:hypothetical protein